MVCSAESTLTLRKAVFPSYPTLANRAREQTTLVVVFTVNRKGLTENIAIEGRGHVLFDRHLLAAVAQWEFIPPSQPEPHKVRFIFKLLKPGSAETVTFVNPDLVEITGTVVPAGTQAGAVPEN